MPDPVGRVKSCTECRQQKVRCDAYKDYTQPCSRCHNAQLPCIISKDFQRRPKQSKAQLQLELERLKAQTNSNETSPEDESVNNEQPPAEPPLKRRRKVSGSDIRNGHIAQPSTSLTGTNSSLRDVLRSAPPSSTETAQRTPRAKSLVPRNDDIGDQTLDGILVESQKLKDCYALFMSHYAPYLEGLCDGAVTLEKRHRHAPLHFWTMICVGSRGYSKDPSLYPKLGPAVLKLTFDSLISPPNPLQVIQAAIILCNWPLPIDLIYKEPCQALAGAASNIAVQNGLHMYTREQDFIVRSYNIENSGRKESITADDPVRARNRIRDEAVIARTRVWVHSLLVFQATYICDGLPPTGLIPCFRRSEVYGESVKLLPELQAYRLKLHRLQIEAVNNVASSCDIESDKEDPVLNAMITTYEDRIRDVAMPRIDNFHLFLRNCVRVSVLALIWLVQQEPNHYHALRLYKAAQEVIFLAESLDQDIHDFTFYMPHFFIRMLMFCGHVVLRVHKSPLGEKLDNNDAEKALSIVVAILKRRATGEMDILAINVAVLTQLWTSKKAFVHNGKPQNGLRVDVRYRMILNPVSDDLWWWRKEFGQSPLITAEHKRCENKTGFPNARDQEDEMNAQVQNGPTQPVPADDGLQNFDSIFQDFQNWWDFATFPMDGFEEGNSWDQNAYPPP